MKTKQAFTLAEVLITLAIIGIIAAITIPSIVANHQKRTLETQFAKTYRTLQTAVNLAVAEHGDISTWDWKETYANDEKNAFVEKYLLEHLNIVKYCKLDKETGCFQQEPYKALDGSDWGPFGNSSPSVVLADGTLVDFLHRVFANTNALSLRVDLNGGKKPNVLGKDAFIFDIYQSTSEFLPRGVYKNNSTMDKTTVEYMQNNCKSSGSHCAAKIVLDGFKINYW